MLAPANNSAMAKKKKKNQSDLIHEWRFCDEWNTSGTRSCCTNKIFTKASLEKRSGNWELIH